MLTRLAILAALALPARAAEPFRLISTTAAKDPTAIVCLISWDATPPPFEAVHYDVYQADAVEGPYTLISTSDTNEITLIVEPGNHFWNVRAISIWNGAPLTSEASKSVGMVASSPGGIGVKKVMHVKAPPALPDALLVPLAAAPPPPAGATQAFTRARTVPTRVPPAPSNPHSTP